MTSLRRRIFIGSVLWTIGMIVLSSAIFSLLIERSLATQRVLAWHVHGALQAPLVVVLAIASLAGGALLVRRGLSRVDELRARLAVVHQGQERRLDGRYPSEIQPLVDDLNALLEHRDAAIRRALAKAGDLAHGLKTPLAVLTQEAVAAEAAGHADVAAAMRRQIERMQRHLDYHLAHARAAASGATPGTRASIRESAEGLARALRRLHAGRGVAIVVRAPADDAVRVQREDLDEMLGNLLDNACKWARSTVSISSSTSGDRVIVTVDDDGPGLAEHLREQVLKRGVRADEVMPGTGLGLAIVQDLAQVYGGSIGLQRSESSGCRAVLSLPVADPG
jgi:signal transduction histidine kinase